MAKYKPFQILELPWFIPEEKKVKPHPAMVVSPEDLEDDEGFFYAVMMSTKNRFPNYTYKIDNSMLTKALLSEGYFVTHFIAPFQLNEVMQNLNSSLKTEFRKPVFDKIKKSILAI